MAAGTLAAPGTEYGPCEDECQHTDCASTRKMAEAKCWCGEPIGYDVRFYVVDEGYAHALCEEAAAEAARDAGSRIAHDEVFGEG